MNGYFMYCEICDTEAQAEHLAGEWVDQVNWTDDYKMGRIFITWMGSYASIKVRKDAAYDYAVERYPWGLARIVVHKWPKGNVESEETSSYAWKKTIFPQNWS